MARDEAHEMHSVPARQSTCRPLRPRCARCVVARRHAIAPSLLHRWRSDATDERRPALPRFAEVIADVVAPRDVAIEIEASGLRVRVPVATRTDTLVAILGVLRGHR